MKTRSRYLFKLLLIGSLCVSCSQGTGIFPLISLSTTESEINFPNPISLAIDTANSQIVVANSNVDILFEGGSLAVLAVDATDTNNPILTAQKIIGAPNFAGEMFYDGAGALYVPFREEAGEDSLEDIFKKYTLTAGDIVDAITGAVAADPFGITGTATSVLTVSDNYMSINNATLGLTNLIDLRAATNAGLADSTSDHVQSVALDTVNNLAIVSNAADRMFVIDMSTLEVIQTIDGPLGTRAVLIDSQSHLYALDSLTEAVWIFDLNLLPARTTTSPETVDDSVILLGAVGVGNNPNGMALDEANNRLYVANYNDDSISVIETVTYTEIDRISLDADVIPSSFLRGCDGPFGLQVGNFNSVPYVFTTCFKSNAIVMINALTLAVVEVFPNTAL